MVSVAVIPIELEGSHGFPTRRTVADGTGILKNKVLTLSDPNTAAEVSDTSNPQGYPFAGVSAIEKEASDGATQLPVLTKGKFEVQASGAITIRCPIKSVGRGYFAQATAGDFASGVVCGYALETASDQEQINVYLGSGN